MKILKKEVRLKGKSLIWLAEAVGLSQTAINSWIQGKTRPSAESVKKLKKLGFSDSACLEPSKEVEV